jgi:hypothetical protein
MRSASRAGGLTPALAAIVLFVSILWGTVTMMTVATTAFVAGGGFGAVNVFVVFFAAFWGPVLGGIAGGAHVLASFILGRVLPIILRDLAAALLGWSAALALWGLIAFGGSDTATVVGSVLVASAGAALNFAVVRSRLRSV